MAQPTFVQSRLGLTLTESAGFGFEQVPAFVDISSSSSRCQGDVPARVPAPASVARPLVGECRSCSDKVITIRTLSAELAAANERNAELQKQLQESQQALLVHLASESLKPHRDSHQEASDSFSDSPVQDARLCPTVAEESPPVSFVSGPSPVKMSCNVNVPELIRCAEKGDEKAVEAHLRSGEDANSTDDMGLAALHGAAKKGHLQVVLLLLHYRANPNHVAAWRGETPLHYACKYGHDSIARLLLISKARPDVRSQENKTPLQYAKDKKHKTLENTLEEAIRCLQV